MCHTVVQVYNCHHSNKILSRCSDSFRKEYKKPRSFFSKVFHSSSGCKQTKGQRVFLEDCPDCLMKQQLRQERWTQAEERYVTERPFERFSKVDRAPTSDERPILHITPSRQEERQRQRQIQPAEPSGWQFSSLRTRDSGPIDPKLVAGVLQLPGEGLGLFPAPSHTFSDLTEPFEECSYPSLTTYPDHRAERRATPSPPWTHQNGGPVGPSTPRAGLRTTPSTLRTHRPSRQDHESRRLRLTDTPANYRRLISPSVSPPGSPTDDMSSSPVSAVSSQFSDDLYDLR
jgi:hypothetical protein